MGYLHHEQMPLFKENNTRLIGKQYLKHIITTWSRRIAKMAKGLTNLTRTRLKNICKDTLITITIHTINS